MKNIKNNTVKLNESQLRKIVTESVDRVLMEDWKDDYEYTISKWEDSIVPKQVAVQCGFKPEYTDFYGYEVWEGNLNGKSEEELKSLLGIKRFLTTDYKGKVRVLVDPSGRRNELKTNESSIRRIVSESVRKVLNEYAWTSGSTFKELQTVLDKVTEILGEFSNNIPREDSDEFMKLVGREWNNLWESISSIEETVMDINNPRGLSDGDLTFDDLS